MKLDCVRIKKYLDLSDNLLPQTQRERDAETAEAAKAAVKEQEKLQINTNDQEKGAKLCW